MKKCSKCHSEKPIEQFGKRKKSADEHMGVCRECANESARRRPRHKARAMVAKYHNKHRAYFLIRYARDRAAQRGWEFDLDSHRSEIQSRIDAGVCEVSGIPLDLNGCRSFNSPSLDRIDPSRGYTYDNIRIICFAMNGALGNWGEEVLHAVVTSWLRKRSREEVAAAYDRIPEGGNEQAALQLV